MRRIKEALHKLRVTPIYLFPKSRSTRYMGIDQVEKHDAPFIKDYLIYVDKTPLEDFLEIKFENVYIDFFHIVVGHPTLSSSPIPQGDVSYVRNGAVYRYLPAISEEHKEPVNLFCGDFRIKILPTTPINYWWLQTHLIKLAGYKRTLV